MRYERHVMFDQRQERSVKEIQTYPREVTRPGILGLKHYLWLPMYSHR